MLWGVFWDYKITCLAKQGGLKWQPYPSFSLPLQRTNQRSSSSVHVWSRAVHSSFSSSLGFWDETAGLVPFSLQLLRLATFVWRKLIGQYHCPLLTVWQLLWHQRVPVCHHTPWTCAANPVSSHHSHFLEDVTISSTELSSVESTCFFPFPFPFHLQKLFDTQKTHLVLKISQGDQRWQWGRPILMQQVSDPPAACPLRAFYFLSQVMSQNLLNGSPSRKTLLCING